MSLRHLTTAIFDAGKLKPKYRPGLWTGGFVAWLDYYIGHEKDCQEVSASVPTGAKTCGFVAII